MVRLKSEVWSIVIGRSVGLEEKKRSKARKESKHSGLGTTVVAC